MTRRADVSATCATCAPPSAGILVFIKPDHSHIDYESCVTCATDARLNSLAHVAWTAHSSGALVARGVEGAA